MLRSVLDHLGIAVDDVEAATGFYLRLLAPLGVTEMMRHEVPGGTVVGLAGPDGTPDFWLEGTGRPCADALHIAFSAPDRAAVEAVHRAAVEIGAEVLHEPKEWPQYHPGYYAVFVRDPDGNNVEAVCHR
jgi:catechol 2,3-dioxygenase-like lactoylglutathione lyase family enzyme